MEILNRLLLHGLDGLTMGWLLALISFGLSLIFGLLNIINVAHGTFYMLGAFFAWYFALHLGNFWLGLLLAPVAVGMLGGVLEVVVLKPVEKLPAMTILSTFGLLLILDHVVLLTFGPSPRSLAPPIRATFSLGRFEYPFHRLFVAGLAMTVALSLWLFLHRTRYGMWIRAVKQNRELALAEGVPVPQVFTLSFALGAAVAALSGVLAGSIQSVEFQMGSNVLVLSFIVVIVGGVGNLKGAVIAGLLVGVVEGLASVFLDPAGSRVLVLAFMAAILLFRSEGLFATA
jgi:branched-chain amino acid transport system permease protein